MRRLLTEAEFRERLGRNALEHVVHYRASAVVPRIERVYADLVARAGGAVRARDSHAESIGAHTS
jgi:hypothetical protein